jgi:ABC-type multidrug transport system fused ATPase/permease subunit
MILFQDKNIVFWSCYIFSALILILQILLNSEIINTKEINVKEANVNENIKNSLFNSLPLSIVSSSYFLIQLLLSIVLMSISSFELSLISQIILLGMFLIIVILLFKSRDYITANENFDEKKVAFLESVRKELEVLSNKVKDDELRKGLNDLIETARYSNPVSKDNVIPLEYHISDKLSELKQLIYNNENDKFENDKILRIVAELKDIFLERNIRLK